MKKIKIIKVSGKNKRGEFDFLTEETTLSIRVNGKHLVTLYCSSRDVRELVIGHLYTTGAIARLCDIRTLNLTKRNIAEVRVARQRNPQRTPARTSGVTIRSQKLLALMRTFHNSCAEFKRTGGVHSVALCDTSKILVFKEDLGRHNAFDKVAGKALEQEIPVHDKIILTSGRIPLEIITKVQRCCIPIIASVSAPTAQAVALARKERITLIGFCRKNKMNIYSAEARIQ
ncbi:MAG: formate dehydrogenase accessory sulfurtransferase FdhD [Candidatus Omnitrophica bacterium]|nr:formate dehydrogenase accessory sulfurtransferase FdhD [Candidatus Omnitrophota bacterium]